MRVLIVTLPLFALAGAPAALAASAQSVHCAAEAKAQHLSGAEAEKFRKSCMTGSLAPHHPTAPVGRSEESKAVTAPSGADRTRRSKECDAAADKRRLTGQSRKEFRLSCLATAGPTGEGETHNQPPKPAPSIKGIGENNYNRPPGAPTPQPPPK